MILIHYSETNECQKRRLKEGVQSGRLFASWMSVTYLRRFYLLSILQLSSDGSFKQFGVHDGANHQQQEKGY